MTGGDITKHTILFDLMQARAKNLPVLQGDMMVSVMIDYEHELHNGWQYTNINWIWQADNPYSAGNLSLKSNYR